MIREQMEPLFKNKKESSLGVILNNLTVIVAAILALSYLSFSNYPLFHNIVNLLIIVVGVSIFIMSMNTYEISYNKHIIFLGISFAFVSGFNLLIAFFSKGTMGTNTDIFNLSLQLSTVSSYIQSISLLIFSSILDRNIKLRKVYLAYGITAITVLPSIFYFKIFPRCYIYESGYTLFTLISRIIISAILAVTVILMLRNRKKHPILTPQFIISGTALLFLSEVISVNYTAWTSVGNAMVSILKFAALCLFYKGIVETSLKIPYKELFFKLAQINENLEHKTNELEKTNKKLNKENEEYKIIEEELRQSRKNYLKLIDFLPYAIFVHCEEKIVFINKAALNLFKIKDYKDIIGKDALMLVRQDRYESTMKNMKDVYNGKQTELIEQEMLAVDGTTLYVETKAVPYVHKGKAAGLVVAGDISERRNAEEKDKMLKEAIEYDRIKTEFFANISHELRTPLNVIFGAIQLVDFYAENDILVDNMDNLNKYIKNMKQNSYRMLRLINNLIDLTKIDSGFLKLNLKNYNIVSIVEDITMSVVGYIESKHLNIQFDTEMEEKIMACDGDMIERIILNLLSNSIKFTNTGGSINVNIYDGEEYITISIKDTGIGISQEKLPIIFERFRQVDKSLARMSEGSGIGLSLVKSLVEMHGGEIYAESEYGHGTEFIIKLPVYVLPEEEVAADVSIQDGKVERINIEFSDIYS